MTSGVLGSQKINRGHPRWCVAEECRTSAHAGYCQEVAHQAELYTLELAAPATVVAPEGRERTRKAVVTIMSFDDFDRAGRLLAIDPPTVVLDVPDGVTALSREEAARLGAALLRASRTLAPGGSGAS